MCVGGRSGHEYNSALGELVPNKNKWIFVCLYKHVQTNLHKLISIELLQNFTSGHSTLQAEEIPITSHLCALYSSMGLDLLIWIYLYISVQNLCIGYIHVSQKQIAKNYTDFTQVRIAWSIM